MVSLARVTDGEAEVLRNLFQFFCHDLAAFDEPQPMHDGRYVVDHFDVYLTHPGMASFLICDDGAPVGFVIVSLPPHFMNVHCVQHLFVLNGHRRKGLAGAAMSSVFRAYPGEYRVGQPFDHDASTAFWRALYAREGIAYDESVEGEGFDKERVQRFVVGPPTRPSRPC